MSIFDIKVALDEREESHEETGRWELLARCRVEVGTSSAVTPWSQDVSLIESARIAGSDRSFDPTKTLQTTKIGRVST